MGIRERVVKQTITEIICDLCKKPADDKAQVGTLAVKRQGARGRPREHGVAFHEECLKKLTDTAVRGNGATQKQKKAAKGSTSDGKKATGSTTKGPSKGPKGRESKPSQKAGSKRGS